MKTMLLKFLIIVPIFTVGLVSGQTLTGSGNQLTVDFSHPNKPGKVDVNIHFGSVHVIGYNGKQVIIDSKFGSNRMFPDSLVNGIFGAIDQITSMLGDDSSDEAEKSTEGMYKIPNLSTEMQVEEEDNVMEIRGGTFRQSVDLNLQVPYETSIKINTMGGGSIRVENVRGEIDVNNINGGISLQNISGPVLANSVSGEIMATFRNPIADNPTSFTTMSGDIDVTFPQNLKADLKIKSQMGEIYTDYKVTLKSSPDNMKVTDERSTGGSYQMEMEKVIHAVVGSGGTEIKFNTFSGDIYIRKAK